MTSLQAKGPPTCHRSSWRSDDDDDDDDFDSDMDDSADVSECETNPVSSCNSRLAASTVRSPYSIFPPGNDHIPQFGGFPLRIRRYRGDVVDDDDDDADDATLQRTTTDTAARGTATIAGRTEDDDDDDIDAIDAIDDDDDIARRCRRPVDAAVDDEPPTRTTREDSSRSRVAAEDGRIIVSSRLESLAWRACRARSTGSNKHSHRQAKKLTERETLG